MKTKLIALTYRGSASVDPRFSAAMLPWTINDIRSMENFNRLSIGIENGLLEAYNADFELQFFHHLKYIVGMCRIVQKHEHSAYSQIRATHTSKTNNNLLVEFQGPINGMVYLLKDPKDPLLHIYLYESESPGEMAELMHQMHRDPSNNLGGSVGSIPQSLVSSPGSTQDLSIQKVLRGNGMHSTPASNLKFMEELRNAQPDPSPNLMSSKMTTSKSYTHGLSNSAGAVNMSSSNSASSKLSLLGDISPNHTHFFEVMYVGKIRVSHKRVPFTFIDDALPKFRAYDAQRTKIIKQGFSRRLSNSVSTNDGSVENVSTQLKESEDEGKDIMKLFHNNKNDKSKEVLFEKDEKNSEEDSKNSNENERVQITELKIVEDNDKDEKSSTNSEPQEESKKKLEKGSSIESEGDNSVVEQLEQEDSESSTDVKERKPLLRGKSQGFISVGNNQEQDNMVPQIKTEQESEPHSPHPPQLQFNIQIEGETNSASNISPEIIPPKPRDRSASYGCIPLVEQNRTMVFLVGRSDLRLISPDRKQVLLYKDFKDVASCAQGHKNSDHFGIICREGNHEGYIGYVFKCQSEQVADDIIAAISQAFITCSEQKEKEKSQIFSCEHCPMLWYHKLCSDIEGLSDKKVQSTIFRRIETLTDDEQDIIWAKYYGAEKMKTHNLTEQNQFLMMLLRAHCESRQQRHVHDTAENRSEFLNQYLGGSTIFMKAKRSLTSSFDQLLKRKGSKDDFGPSLKEFHSAREVSNVSEGSNSGGEGSESHSGKNKLPLSPNAKPSSDQLKSPMMDIFIKVGNSPKDNSAHQGSWRQAILNSVVTPSKNMGNRGTENEFLSPIRAVQAKRGKRTKEELRDLWRTATRQIVLLSRMEKENARIQADQNENELKKIKLDYDEICPCDKQAVERWEIIMERDSMKITNRKDPKVLLQAIKNGVPRSKRGEVWTFLAEQHSMHTAPVDTKKFPNFNTPYNALLKNLTEHQHAIFIDLGRTFPNHKYYKAPLGVGQLSLFNLLKAYSILDPELGYCQGLGFLCGVLLLHCNEVEAFQLLKHLMFRRQMRTKYLPDMKMFQLQLYQLSRLVKDHLHDLYDWLDENDVSPTLYAAPWILTVFSSQFPLGFVVRVFDLLFLESSDVIFKVAIGLLTVHKEELLKRDNFEDIMDYLKNVVPKIDNERMDKVMKYVFSMDISKQLAEYQVEYNVLQEEISSANHHLEMLRKEKHDNQRLESQLQFAQSSIAQLEKTRSLQQSQITSLQSQVQTLEVTIQTLGRYVAQIIEKNHDIDLPNDVRRIIQQIDDIEKQRKKPLFVERRIGKSMSVNSNLGFPLKVLEELNEREAAENSSSSPVKKKTPFFENTYEQLRQQRAMQQRPEKLIGSSDHQQQKQSTVSLLENKKDDNKLYHAQDIKQRRIRSPSELDSGIGTPLSPPSSLSLHLSKDSNFTTLHHSPITPLEMVKEVDNTASQSINSSNLSEAEMHPLSMCGDVNFKFNGTTQLRTIKPTHPKTATSLSKESQMNNSNRRS